MGTLLLLVMVGAVAIHLMQRNRPRPAAATEERGFLDGPVIDYLLFPVGLVIVTFALWKSGLSSALVEQLVAPFQRAAPEDVSPSAVVFLTAVGYTTVAVFLYGPFLLAVRGAVTGLVETYRAPRDGQASPAPRSPLTRAE